MRDLVREWGRANPLELESKGDGSFEVLMPSEESVERLLAYNYHEVEGSDQVLQVKKCWCNFLWSIFLICSKSTWGRPKTSRQLSLGGSESQGSG